MERMTGFDSSLLHLETEQQPLVVGATINLDVSGLRGGYTFERFRTELARRVKQIPELRRKIYDSPPLNLGRPAWVEEYHLDVTDHVRRVVVDEPGDERAVFEACGALGSRPLDRARPLWEIWVLEGLAEPDTVAVYFRAHHAILDGATSAEILRTFGAAGSDASAGDLEPVRVQAGGTNILQLVAGGLWDFSVRRPITLTRLVPEALTLPFTLRRATASAKSPDAAPTEKGQGPEKPPSSRPFTAPRTRFNATITPRRSVWGPH